MVVLKFRFDWRIFFIYCWVLYTDKYNLDFKLNIFFLELLVFLSCLVGGCDPNNQVVKLKGKTAMHAAAAGGYVDIIAILRLVRPLKSIRKFSIVIEVYGKSMLEDFSRFRPLKTLQSLIDAKQSFVLIVGWM